MSKGSNSADEQPSEIESLRSRIAELECELDQSRRAATKFRLAAESLPTAMVMVDERGQIALINAQTEKLFGYSRGELLGQTVEVLVPERFRRVHPGYRDMFLRDPTVRAMGAGRDLFGQHSDGREFPVEIGLNPIQTDEGMFVLSTIVDITERRRAEERFRRAVESAPNALVIVDQEGRIVLVNGQTEMLFGYNRHELFGCQVEMIIPEHSRANHPAYRHSDFANQEVRATELSRDQYGQRKDGTKFPVEIGLNPIQIDDGCFVLSAIVDITERRRIEQRLQQFSEELERSVAERTAQLEAANKELEAFSYSVSHDLRAPLRAIDGFSRILLRDHAGQLSAEGLEYLQDVRSNTQQMGRLVDDLLSFARFSRQPINKIHFSTTELIQQCWEELGKQTAGRRITIEMENLPDSWADMTLLKQVWLNLISNALKYSAQRETSEIKIGCQGENQPGQHTFFVQDNGVGFDMSYAHKLFGVFQRLHRAEDYEGTGVGLAIVQRIVQRHGGRVWADSKPNLGATFFFSLPNEIEVA